MSQDYELGAMPADPAAVRAACETLQNLRENAKRRLLSYGNDFKRGRERGAAEGSIAAYTQALDLLAALSAPDEARQNLEAAAREVCAALKADDLRLMINRAKALGVVLAALPKQALAAQLPAGKQEGAGVAVEGEMKEAREG